jgi:cysteine synthase
VHHPRSAQYRRGAKTNSVAEEIWKDTDGKADILVAAVGTRGTITGVSEVLKSRKQAFLAIVVEPKDSPVIIKGSNHSLDSAEKPSVTF